MTAEFEHKDIWFIGNLFFNGIDCVEIDAFEIICKTDKIIIHGKKKRVLLDVTKGERYKAINVKGLGINTLIVETNKSSVRFNVDLNNQYRKRKFYRDYLVI